MIEESDAHMVDESLAQLPDVLSRAGLIFTQRKGYKAGKLRSRKNWCELVDGDVPIRICFPNMEGEKKTWKLFARFEDSAPPPQPWDRPQQYERKKAQWMPAGDDVWAVAYEDLAKWTDKATSKEIVHILARDLQRSFSYATGRYK